MYAGWTSHALEEWAIFGNSRYNVYSIGLPPIKKQKFGRVGSMIVPEFYSDKFEEKIEKVNGDATKPRGAGNKIIAQIVNTSGGLGFGFGKSISKAFPLSKKAIVEWMNKKEDFVLGNSQSIKLTDDIYVFQMIAQKGIFPKGNMIPLRYDSLQKCLSELADEAIRLNATVHMPQIGAGQAKGDWGIIEGMINETLISKGIKVTIYILPGTKFIHSKQIQNLTLFD